MEPDPLHEGFMDGPSERQEQISGHVETPLAEHTRIHESIATRAQIQRRPREPLAANPRIHAIISFESPSTNPRTHGNNFTSTYQTFDEHISFIQWIHANTATNP